MAEQLNATALEPDGPYPRRELAAERRSDGTSRELLEDGFTLLELMIAVAIMGLLMAIAIPTFLGARTRAQDSAAQATIRATFDTAGAILSSPNPNGQPLDLLKQNEPRFSYTFAASTDPETVSFALSATQVDMVPSAFTDRGAHAAEDRFAIGALIAAKSRSGSCVVGIWHLTAGTAIATVPATEMPTCRAADIDTTLFNDVYRRGGTSTGGAGAYVCADSTCFGDSPPPQEDAAPATAERKCADAKCSESATSTLQEANPAPGLRDCVDTKCSDPSRAPADVAVPVCADADCTKRVPPRDVVVTDPATGAPNRGVPKCSKDDPAGCATSSTQIKAGELQR